MTLHKHAVWGITVAYAAHASDKLSVFATTVVLAHVLAPSVFGAYVSIMLLVIFVDTFRDFGFTDALVYMDDSDGLASDTTFWFSAASSAVLAITMFLSAPMLSHIFFSDQDTNILRAMAVWVLISGLGLTHEAVLGKRLAFTTRYSIDMVAAAAKTALSILLAVAGFGIWSLVGGLIGGAAVRTNLRWLLTPWRPQLRFSKSKWIELYQYGRHVLVVKIIDYVEEKIDQITIVWLLGEIQLAFYYMALRFPELLFYQFNAVLTRIMYPVFARMRSEGEALTEFLLAASRYTALIVLPIGLGLAITADLTVTGLLGAKWEPAAAPLVTLSLAATFQTLLWSTGDMFKAVGRPDIPTRISLLELSITVPTVVLLVAITKQLWTAGLGFLVSAMIGNLARLLYAQKVLDIAPLHYLRVFVPAFLASAVMSLAVFGARLLVQGSPTLVLVVCVLVGATAYIGCLMVIDRRNLKVALSLLRSTFSTVCR